MGSPYSLDLRQKVITAINNGMSKSEASLLFQLSRNTIHLWFQRLHATGSLAPSKPRRTPRGKLQDLNGFRVFADAHPDWTLKKFGAHGGVSFQTISKTFLPNRLHSKKKTRG